MVNKKIPKTVNQLEKDLVNKNEYLKKLLKDANQYEPGNPMREEYAVNIAVILRLLLHKTKHQTPLLEQVGIFKDLLCISEIRALAGPNNLVPESKLTITRVKGKDGYFVHKRKFENKINMVFESWWNEIVMDNKDKNQNLVSRREIVLALANKEGAHVDPDYDSKYYKICFNNGFKLGVMINDIEIVYRNNPYKEIIFSIAYEYLHSLENLNKMKKYFKVKINQSSDILVSMNNQDEDSKNSRYFFWFTNFGKPSLLNWIHIDIKDTVTKNYFYLSEYIYKDKLRNKFLKLLVIDDRNKKQATLFHNKHQKLLALVSNEGGKYTILKGSSISPSTILIENVVEENKYSILNKNFSCKNKSELNKALGIKTNG